LELISAGTLWHCANVEGMSSTVRLLPKIAESQKYGSTGLSGGIGGSGLGDGGGGGAPGGGGGA
jgi:hypothetical protein